MSTRLYFTFVFLLGYVASANAQGDPAEIPARYPWGDDSPDEQKANYGRIFKRPYPTRAVKSPRCLRPLRHRILR